MRHSRKREKLDNTHMMCTSFSNTCIRNAKSKRDLSMFFSSVQHSGLRCMTRYLRAAVFDIAATHKRRITQNTRCDIPEKERNLDTHDIHTIPSRAHQKHIMLKYIPRHPPYKNPKKDPPNLPTNKSREGYTPLLTRTFKIHTRKKTIQYFFLGKMYRIKLAIPPSTKKANLIRPHPPHSNIWKDE